MKTFIKISIIGIILIYLAISFINMNINSFTWFKETRVLFIIFSVGWIAMSSIISTGIEANK